MKEWKCSTVVPGCDWSYRGGSDEEVLEHAATHARDAHGMDEIPPEIVDTIRASIVEIPAPGVPPAGP